MSGEVGHTVGRYLLHSEIASGGMATVHLGRLIGAAGFSRTVAIKRLHPWFASEEEFVSMFLDEARLAGRIRHPNVVPIRDVVKAGNELLLVMEYVEGDALSRLIRATAAAEAPIEPGIVVAVMAGALRGLHAAHEAKDERGKPLGIVHRDVSPHNILVSSDGIAQVVDFGVAKAADRLQNTRSGHVKGKLSYMSPEQLEHGDVDRRTDVYAAAQVLWEMLTQRRLFASEDPGPIVTQKLHGSVTPPSELGARSSPELDAVVMKGLSQRADERFATAQEMAIALENATRPAAENDVGAWVERFAASTLAERRELVSQIENLPSAEVAVEARDALVSSPSVSVSPPAVAPSAPTSQVSSVSLVTSTEDQIAGMRPKRRAALLGVAAGLLIVGVTIAIVVARSSSPATTTAASPAPSEARAPSETMEGDRPPDEPSPPDTTAADAASSDDVSGQPQAREETPPTPSPASPTKPKPQPHLQKRPEPRPAVDRKPASDFDDLTRR